MRASSRSQAAILRRRDGFLAEELLAGIEVTLEGYAFEGRVTIVGITDSVKYPGTLSFERFEYPTALPEERRVELADVAARVIPALGFDDGFFNVEFIVPETGPAQIVEVNARIASQFAPLLLGLHGRSSYDALFQLALGEDPDWKAGEPDGVAVSYALRTFEDARRRGGARARPRPRDPRQARAATLRAGRERRPELPACDLHGVWRDARGSGGAGARARAATLSFRLAPVPVR